MASLFIFGFECPLAGPGPVYSVQTPVNLTAGDSWSATNLKIDSDSSLSGQVSLKLQGLPVRLIFNDLQLVAGGGDYRPKPASDDGSVVMIMGAAKGDARRMRVGAVTIDSFLIAGYASGDKAAALIGTDVDLLTGKPGPVRSPLSIMIGSGKSMIVNLAKRQLVIPPGALQVELSAHGPNIGDVKRAGFTNDTPVGIPFADIVAKRVLTLDLQRISGEVPLNIPEKFDAYAGKFPPAPVAATDCRAVLELSTIDDPGSLLSAARLTMPDGGATSLTIQGLRNAGNRAERWTTGEALGLVFRIGKGSIWSTPLLAPFDRETGPAFQRQDDVADKKIVPMHAWFGASQFRPEQAGVAAELRCDTNTVIDHRDLIPTIAKKLQYRVTRPWLRFANTSFHHSRPGTAYQGAANTFVFETHAGYCGGAPLLPRAGWEAGQDVAAGRAGAALKQANDDVNAAFGAMVLKEADSVHETGIADRTASAGASGTGPPAIKAVLPDDRVAAGSVQLSRNDRTHDMASPRLVLQRYDSHGKTLALSAPATLTLPITVPPKTAPDYAVLWPDLDNKPHLWVDLTDLEKWAAEITGAIDPAAPIAVANLFKDLDKRPTDFPLAILKIGRRQTLNEILLEIAGGIPNGAKSAFEAKRATLINGTGTIPSTDPAVLEPDWVGLIVFDAPIDFDAFPLLKAIVPTGDKAPRISFLSVAPREAGSADADISVSAAIDWTNHDQTIVSPADKTQEASFQSKSLSVAFRDRRMIRFHAEAVLVFYTFFGVKSEDGKERPPITIIGSARRVAGSGKDDGAFEIRFAAEVTGGDKLVIFPLNGKVSNSGNTFLESAWLKRVEVTDAPVDGGGRKAEIAMDGSIAFRKPDVVTDGELADFFKGLRAVDFTGLRIDLPDISSTAPRLLTLRYPSLAFNLDLPHIGLIGDALKLKFRQLVLDWEKGLNAFDLGQFPSLPIPGTGPLDLELPKILFIGRIDFGSLPDLFARSLSGFSLEGLFGLNIKDGKFLPDFRPYVGIGGFGFQGLDFDLLSFIRLRIKELHLGRAPNWKNGAKGAAIHLKSATLEVVGVPVLKDVSGAFFSQDRDAGNGFWAAFKGYGFPLFRLDWGFVGQNIDFPPSIPKALLAPPPEKGADEQYEGLTDAINNAWSDGDIVPATGNAGKGWTFAASIQAFQGAFKGKVLFQDGGFAGLSLGGPALKQLLNWDFAFTGIYRKDITPGEDYFYFSITLPEFLFGGVRYTGGAIAAEIYTSGDFMADVGFPWLAQQGGRQWDRTIGAIVTPGQASGGFYVKKRRTHVPNSDATELTISGGVAFQWGLGAAFGGGVFSVWVRIGIYVIVEGSVTMRYSSERAEIVAFMLQGAAGILLEGEGRIDWWIISVRVGIRASAEIRASLIWDGRNGRAPVLMPIDAELSVSAYAEACIGGGCARICRSIQVSIDIPVRYQLQFG